MPHVILFGMVRSNKSEVVIQCIIFREIGSLYSLLFVVVFNVPQPAIGSFFLEYILKMLLQIQKTQPDCMVKIPGKVCLERYHPISSLHSFGAVRLRWDMCTGDWFDPIDFLHCALPGWLIHLWVRRAKWILPTGSSRSDLAVCQRT